METLFAISMSYKRSMHISNIYQISSIKALPTYEHPYIQETTKLIHDFILYTRNFLHEMESKYCLMGSINQDKQ